MRAEEILDRGRALLKSKGDDYTENRDKDQYQNFDRSNLIASWFKNDVDKSFAVLIGTKLARLASLLSSDKVPNNESILDTFIDGANYFALWGGKRFVNDNKDRDDSYTRKGSGIKDQDNPMNPEDYTQGPIQSMGDFGQPANDPHNRNTNCYFCSGAIGFNSAKVITGKYKQAHIHCYNEASRVTIDRFTAKP